MCHNPRKSNIAFRLACPKGWLSQVRALLPRPNRDRPRQVPTGDHSPRPQQRYRHHWALWCGGMNHFDLRGWRQGQACILRKGAHVCSLVLASKLTEERLRCTQAVRSGIVNTSSGHWRPFDGASRHGRRVNIAPKTEVGVDVKSIWSQLTVHAVRRLHNKQSTCFCRFKSTGAIRREV